MHGGEEHLFWECCWLPLVLASLMANVVDMTSVSDDELKKDACNASRNSGAQSDRNNELVNSTFVWCHGHDAAEKRHRLLVWCCII